MVLGSRFLTVPHHQQISNELLAGMAMDYVNCSPYFCSTQRALQKYGETFIAINLDHLKRLFGVWSWVVSCYRFHEIGTVRGAGLKSWYGARVSVLLRLIQYLSRYNAVTSTVAPCCPGFRSYRYPVVPEQNL
jgi:hypothetical protein